MRHSLIAVAALMLASGPGLAMGQVTTITQGPGPSLKTAHKTVLSDGRICRSQMKTGSRLPSLKVCRTPAEWDALEASAKEELDNILRRSGAVNQVTGS
jgi:hypothetical protein